MSFEHSTALESQPTTWRREDDPQYSDDPEFRRYTTELSDKIFSLTSNISRLSNQVGLLGTKRETERVRERVSDLLDETSKGFKDIGEGLKKVQNWPDVGVSANTPNSINKLSANLLVLQPSQKYTQGKLGKEFQASLTEFQVLQRRAIEKEKASAAAARVALDEQGQSSSRAQSPTGERQVQEQERLAPQDEVDFQESLIVERESEIRNIEQSVGELNELFRDVAHMVHEQGVGLDIISENVQTVRDDTRGASAELNTASKYQKAARSKACCLLLILAVVLTIIVVAVVEG